MLKIEYDLPKPNEMIFFEVVEICGWALGYTSIDIYIDHTYVKSTPVNRRREDLLKLQFLSEGENLGYRTFVSLKGLQPGRHFIHLAAGDEIRTIPFQYFPIQELVSVNTGSENQQDPGIQQKLLFNLLLDRQRELSSERSKLAKYYNGRYFDFRGIKIPDISQDIYAFSNFPDIYLDTLMIHTEFMGNLHHEFVDYIDQYLPEGSYCYHGPDGADIDIHSGDVVFDLGAWIGDFAAYASFKGGHVYAFEPSNKNLKWLRETAVLNANITVVPCGVGDKNEVRLFSDTEDPDSSSGSSHISEDGENNVEIVTIDEFVTRNHLTRVDFIKADIEGFERNMLKGAMETLSRFAPKLSICTYHLDDDTEVLTELIRKANPAYKIIYRKKKLFAYKPADNITSDSEKESGISQRIFLRLAQERFAPMNHNNRLKQLEESSEYIGAKLKQMEESSEYIGAKLRQFEESFEYVGPKLKQLEESSEYMGSKLISFEDSFRWIGEKWSELDGFRSRFDILCQENLTTKEKLEQLKSRLSEEMVNIMTLSLNMENLNSLKSDVEAVRTAQQNHQRSLDVLYADLTAAIKELRTDLDKVKKSKISIPWKKLRKTDERTV